jgi:hypothetical protein
MRRTVLTLTRAELTLAKAASEEFMAAQAVSYPTFGIKWFCLAQAGFDKNYLSTGRGTVLSYWKKESLELEELPNLF